MHYGAIMMTGSALMVPTAALGQAPPDAAALKAIEAAVPSRNWYPAGYYDVRIAAEAQVAEAPRTQKDIVSDCFDGGGQCYDVIDCNAESVSFNPDDPVMSRYGDTALEISRLRGELARIGYSEAIYAGPLADYEKALIAFNAKRSDAEVMLAGGAELPEGTEMPSEDESTDADTARETLAAAIEANRARLAPKLPRVIIEGGCGAGEGGPIIVRTVPAGGEVLLISAFAFKVCTRRQPDPWDRFACKWNEWETGVAKTKPYGRFVYQVKWPDGVVRKGTREIVPAMEEESVTVTFKKVGS